MTFYQETLQELHSSIDSFFNHIDVIIPTVATPTTSSASIDVRPSTLIEDPSSILSSYADIILDHLASSPISSSSPFPTWESLDDMRNQLNQLYTLFYKNSPLSSTSPSTPNAFTIQQQLVFKELETMALAKWTALIYSIAMRRLMDASIPLSSSNIYWQEVLQQKRYLFFHFAQTLPLRFMNQFHSDGKTETVASLLSFKHWREGGRYTWSTMFASRRMWLPYVGGLLLPAKWNSIFRLEWLRSEVDEKRSQLEARNALIAYALGLLAEDRFWCPTSREATQSKISSSWVSFQSPLTKAIHRMEWALEKGFCGKACVDDCQYQKHSEHLLSQEEVYQHLQHIMSLLEDICPQKQQQWLSEYGPPGLFTRMWIPALVCIYGFPLLMEAISETAISLHQQLISNAEVIKEFLTDWVWVPCKRIWDTVRRSGQHDPLALLGPRSLESDLESLQRMVVDFVQDKHGAVLPLEKTRLIMEQAKQGDLTPVLQQYEEELKTPIKSVLVGDMVRILLIQVQKSKVDIELAMSALDKLLRSNELNFAFMAVMPTLVVLYFLTVQAKRGFRSISGYSHSGIQNQFRLKLREIHRLLNTCDIKEVCSEQHNEEPMSNLTLQRVGLLLCDTHQLRGYTKRLFPLFSQPWMHLQQDICELERPGASSEQRIRTVDRMWRTYPFLVPM